MNDPTPPSGSDLPPLIGAAPTVLPVRRWRWWFHWLLIAAYPLALGALGWRHDPSSEPALSENVTGLLIVSALEVLVFGFIFSLAWLASRASRDDLLLRWRGGFWTVPLGLGYSVALRVGLAVFMAAVAAVLMASGIMTDEAFRRFVSANRPDVEAIVDIEALTRNPVYYCLTLTLVSFIVAGLREEVWRSAFLAGMRHLWPHTFGSRTGQIGAAALAAVIFGIGHLAQGPLAALFAGLLGLGLGVIMVLHRSIWPAVIAHGFFNAASFALLPFLADYL